MVSDTLNEGSEGTGRGAADKGSAEAHAAGTESNVNPWEQKAQESEKRYLYLYSEFENFRRRNEKERMDFLKFGHEGFLRDLLQVVDNFDRAVEHGRTQGFEKGSAAGQMFMGVEMIHLQLAESLRSQGVVAIATKGAKFDPALHEAVGEEGGAQEPGSVLREMLRGYTLHGRLLRAAKVVICKN